MNKLFFPLLQIALGQREQLPQIPTDEEWQDLFNECKKQALIGIGFQAVEKLALTGIKPTRTLFAKWYLSAQNLAEKNQEVNDAIGHLFQDFGKDGKRICVLKGQGVSLYYPIPFRRNSGDIDAWVDGSPRETLSYLKQKGIRLGKRCYHHVDAGKYNGVELEVHYRPSFRTCFVTDARMQRWFLTERDRQMSNQTSLSDETGTICSPTVDFNLIYEMAHVASHILHEGIGLRQLMDYYYTLQAWYLQGGDNAPIVEKLSRFGMLRTTRAIMYVLRIVFAMPKEWLLCQPDEHYGRFLLQEIMRGGNFGHSDDRISSNERHGIGKAVKRLERDIRFFRFEPRECVWEPIFRLWHYGCRKWYDRY